MSKVEVGQVRYWPHRPEDKFVVKEVVGVECIVSYEDGMYVDYDVYAVEISSRMAHPWSVTTSHLNLAVEQRKKPADLNRDAMQQLSRAMLCIVRGDKYTRAAHGERMALAFNEREIVQQLRAQLIRDKLEAIESKRRCSVAWDPEGVHGE